MQEVTFPLINVTAFYFIIYFWIRPYYRPSGEPGQTGLWAISDTIFIFRNQTWNRWVKIGMVIYFGILVEFIYIVNQNHREIGKLLQRHVTSGVLYGTRSRIHLTRKKFGFGKLLNKILIQFYLEWKRKFILGQKINAQLGKFVTHKEPRTIFSRFRTYVEQTMHNATG